MVVKVQGHCDLSNDMTIFRHTSTIHLLIMTNIHDLQNVPICIQIHVSEFIDYLQRCPCLKHPSPSRTGYIMRPRCVGSCQGSTRNSPNAVCARVKTTESLTKLGSQQIYTFGQGQLWNLVFQHFSFLEDSHGGTSWHTLWERSLWAVLPVRSRLPSEASTRSLCHTCILPNQINRQSHVLKRRRLIAI